MLTGFEKETSHLTEEEKKMIPVLSKGFLTHIGKEKAITEKEISEGIKSYCGIKLQGARFRKLINHMRVNQLPDGYAILSGSEGYWLSNDTKEIDLCSKSLYERRTAILNVSEAMKKTIENLYRPKNSYL